MELNTKDTYCLPWIIGGTLSINSNQEKAVMEIMHFCHCAIRCGQCHRLTFRLVYLDLVRTER